mgnify:CR=1 FL=1
MIKLVNDTINNKDIDKLIKWLGTYPRLTKGPLTLEFEQKWSDWLGSKFTIFCNSGSSANLLMLWALIECGRIKRDAKIVVPSASWATDLSPVIQLGMTPILCDANLEDLSVDLDHLERIFKETSPDVLLLVSVLGLVPKMEKITELCEEYDVILLEDTCESMGSKYEDKKLGTFGLMSSFSTYFGHHMSTIEGGLIRSTDLQSFIGIGQIDKLDEICKKRNSNFKIYNELLSDFLPYIKDNGFISNFAYPVITKDRDKIIKKLQDANIEVRPMICGSMGTQPFYVKRYGRKELPNVSMVDKYGFYIPNHPELTRKQINKIVKIIKE